MHCDFRVASSSDGLGSVILTFDLCFEHQITDFEVLTDIQWLAKGEAVLEAKVY